MKLKFKKKYLSLTMLSILLAIAGNSSAANDRSRIGSERFQRPAASVPTTKLVSVNSTGMTSGNAGSTHPVLSSNGRFVAFVSNAADLVSNDTNGLDDIFLRDLKTQTTTLVSINSMGTTSGLGMSLLWTGQELSANGQYLTFVSDASDLVANDMNDTWDVFVRDLKNRTTKLVSPNSAGTASSNNYSLHQGLSSDGRFVAFQSGSSDLTANDDNDSDDIFVRDLKTRKTILASIDSTGATSGNNNFFTPMRRTERRFMAALQSNASGLAANNANEELNLFVSNLRTGTVTLADINNDAAASGNNISFNPVISANGRFVAFHSYANNLVANDANDTLDVFVRDLKNGTTILASINSSGTASGAGMSFLPETPAALSADGRFVAFQSAANDLVENDANNNIDIFVRDLKTGTTTLASGNSAGTASGLYGSLHPVLSADGRFVAFHTVGDDSNPFFIGNVFVHDLKTGVTKLVSVNITGITSGNSDSFNPVLSADGRFIAFSSTATDLAGNDTNGATDVFVRDLKTGKTVLTSVNSTGTASGNDNSFNPVFSADGRFVAFQSIASDLVENDNNNAEDVFMRPVGK
jgi:phosphopantothenate synthetase